MAPLDWGLGHATRCIPLIKELQNRNCEITIASSGNALTYLMNEFPEVPVFKLPSYSPRYPNGNNSMVWKMATQLPKFIQTIYKENHETEDIVRSEKINVIISDNRYGCYSKEVKSIFVYHQPHL